MAARLQGVRRATAYRPGGYHGGAYRGAPYVNRNVNASGNWNAYYGPHYGGALPGRPPVWRWVR